MKNNVKSCQLIGRKQLYKFFRAMKLTIMLMVFCLLQVSAEVYTQTNQFTLNLKDKQVIEVLKEIENQSDFRFFYQDEQIDVNQKVSINLFNKDFNQVIQELFSNQNISYKIFDNGIVLLSKNNIGSTNNQELTIKGKVTDSDGTPLPGVNVFEKGTTNGSVTNLEGEYTITVSSPDAELSFSYVGYLTEDVDIAGQSVIDIILVEDVMSLDEVVVVGYGTQKKVNLTGAVTSVSGEDMTKRPVANAETMLQGLMPGVQITQNSGEPGNESVSIRIRGTGTFSSAGSDPLVLIDGVQGNLSDLNPNNIENISVLKDAASASIYGARAANGVILVTTKSGKAGKVTMEYNGNYGMHSPTKMFELITNSAEYMELFNEARVNSGLTELYTDEMIETYRNATDRNLYPNTDWLDLLFNPAPTQTHNLSFRGGSDKTQFNVSLGYVNQEGVMKSFDYKKYNVRVNLTSHVNDKIKFGGNFYVKKGEKTAPRSGGSDMFLAAMSQAPTYAPQLADGSGRYSFKAYDFEYNNKNPMAIIGNEVNKDTDDYMISSQGWVDIQLAKGLSWYTKGAINLDFSKYSDFLPQVPLYNFRTNEYMTLLDVGGAGLTVRDDQSVYKNLFSYLTFDKEFGGGNQVSAKVGYSVEDNVYQYLQGYRKEYPSDRLRELDAGSPSVQQTYGTKEEWALMSFFGRLGYNYKERYLLEANVRYDGTSRLASDSRWGAFPSFSAGWRLTEEPFFQSLGLSWVDNIKFRGSYGELGNQNIGLYPYQSKLALTGNYSFDDSSLSSGVAQTDLSNSTIKWEATSVTDFGFDLTFFQKLNITFDWYKKRTTDILRSSQVTNAVGLNAPTVNNGTMENKGIEVNLMFMNRVTSGSLSGLEYNLGLNIDHYKNELVDFGEQEISGYYLREEGHEWEGFYMLEWIGIFQSEEEIANSPAQYNDATVPGDLKFKDANGDGVVNDDDRVPISGKFPSLNYSFNLAANWKNFDFSALLQGVKGVKYYVNNWGTIPFVQGAPPTTDWKDRWTETNPSTSMPRMYWGWGAPSRISRNSSWYLQDGSYIRLKNLTFGYTITNEFMNQRGIENLRVYFSGDNLFTITDYRGLDPERGGNGYLVNYPQNKIYSFGVNVKF